MDTDISDLSSLTVIVSITFFTLISFVQHVIGTVTRESIFIWRSEERSGLEKLEDLFRKADQSNSAFSIIKTISLASAVINCYFIFYQPSQNQLTSYDFGRISLIAISTLIVLGVLETIAKVAGRHSGPRVAVRIYRIAIFIGTTLRPITRSQERLIEISTAEENPSDISENSNIAMQMDDEGEPLEEHEVRMIRGVFQLDKTVVREIMIPRVDMIIADISTPINDVVDIMIREGHSKIPIYRNETDQIEGIAHSMDILGQIKSAESNNNSELKEFLRPVLFIPESKTLEFLLTDFQDKRMQMAIVIDEYGGVSGLVTVEDLVEEIVGELHDEFDTRDLGIREVEKNEFYMDASIAIDDIALSIGVSFEGEGFDTIGGFVLHELGKIPSPGDNFSYNNLSIEVISTVGRRLREIKILKT
ncbi:MAG TPA: HlyC/CorC family transporter [Dehalococcoidia bacterium]|nr:HlyC/CorC family transporter [Dehalococcoidia bacterium]